MSRRPGSPFGLAFFGVILGLLSVPIWIDLPSVDSASSVVPSELRERAHREGRVRVLAEMRLPGGRHVPEHQLSAAAAGVQRSDIVAVRGQILQRLSGRGHRVLRHYGTVPFVALDVDPGALADLDASSQTVRRVVEDAIHAPTLMQSGPLIGADQGWTRGYDGTGTVVAILDTGVEVTHPFLAGKVVEEGCYSSTVTGVSTTVCPNGLETQTGAGAGVSCSLGSCWHGTHVAGIAAGNGGGAGVTFSGVAKGAQVMAVQVFSKFSNSADCGGSAPCVLAWTSDIIAGLERVYAVRASRNLASANLSLGGGTSTTTCDTDPMKSIIDNLRAAGIATVIAAGNNSRTNAISSPGCISSAISVGATTKADVVASYSNAASFMSLFAPGSSIYSSVLGGAFGYASGTSMATPHVTGTWAVLKQAAPNATVTQILSALQTTGLMITDTRSGGTVTKPRIRIDQALTALVPTVTSVTPNQGALGAAVPVTINGTGFVAGSAVGFSGTGVTVSNVILVSATQMTATLTVAGGAAVGARDLTVTNPNGGSATLVGAFSVTGTAVTVTSIAPNQGTQGAAVPVTITGTGFAVGATVGLSGTGITVSNVSVGSATQITATLTLASGTTVGARNVTVTNSSGTTGTLTGGFTVVAAVTVVAVTPNQGAQGAAVPVTITGTGFAAGAAVGLSGTGITVSNVSVGSATQLTATLTLTSGATLGARNVTVTNSSGGAATLTGGFTVVAPAPPATVGSVAPNQGAQGAAVPVTITGTGFAAGATVSLSGTGITVSNVSVGSATQLTATLTLASGATLGARDLTVTNPGGGAATLSGGFTVVAPVTIGSVTPNQGAQGATVPVTITGTGFAAGAAVGLSGTGITVSNVSVGSATQLTATFTLTSGATLGARNVTVTNSSGTAATRTGGFTVVAPAAPATVGSVTPTQGAQGAVVPVTITGAGFAAGATVSLSGTGITVSNVSVGSATQITATLTLASSATLGARDLTVTNPGGGASTLTGGFTVTSAVPATLSLVYNGLLRDRVGQENTALGPDGALDGTLTATLTASGGRTITALRLDSSAPGTWDTSSATPFWALAVATTLNGTVLNAPGTMAVNFTVADGGSFVVFASDLQGQEFLPGRTLTLRATFSDGSTATAATTVSSTAVTVASVAPNQGTQGTAVPVTITGTGFAAGAAVSLSGTGITVSNVSVGSATQLTATLTLASSATLGTRNITVTNSSGAAATLTGGFTVVPPVTIGSVTPNQGAQGAAVPVTITGTGFAAGATVSLSGTGITVSNVSVGSATQMTATLTLASNATLGARNVTVTNSSGSTATLTGAFTVTSAAGTGPATLSLVYNGRLRDVVGQDNTALGPDGALDGTLTATLTASGGRTLTALRLDSSAPGTWDTSSATPFWALAVATTLNGTVLNAPGSMAVNFAVADGGSFVVFASDYLGGEFLPGRNLTLLATFSDGSTATAVTTVSSTTVTVASVTPNQGAQGAAVPVTITGTGFAAGATVSLSGTGITVSNVSVGSATQLTATLSLTSGAPLGARNVTVTNLSGATATRTGGFTVVAPVAAVTVASVTPNQGAQGAAVPVTITGTGFAAGATVSLSGTGITVSNVVVTSTQITATLTLTSGATLGARNVTVTNSSGGTATLTGGFTVTSAAGGTGPATLSLVYGGKLRDVVGQDTAALGPDGALDGTLTATLTASGGRTLTALRLDSSAPGTWDTSSATPFWALAVATTQNGTVLNAPGSMAVNFTVADGGSFVVFASDYLGGEFLPGRTLTLLATFSDGSTATAVTTVSSTTVTVASVTPNQGAQGAAVPVTITGTGFAAGATVSLSGTGITVSNVSVGSATQLTATLSLTSGAPLGARNVTVTNLSGATATRTGGFTVTSAAGGTEPATLSLVYNGRLRDLVGQGNTALGPDGALDGTLTATLTATGGRTITALRLDSSAPGTWDTSSTPDYWVLGVATTLNGATINAPGTMAVNFTVADGGSFVVFASDYLGGEFLQGRTLTLVATFSDGTSATATTTVTLGAGFTTSVLANGLSNPTAMAFAPDGRLFVTEQGGRVRVIKSGALLATEFVAVTADSSGERGLLGIAFDPNFSTNQFVYVYYTATTPTTHNRVSRFTASGDVAVAGSETVILDLDTLSGATNHNGGGIHFGLDGKLYIGVGENANGANAQTLANLLGKMLRINPDGSIPSNNPFFGSAVGVNRAIWALGLRNPFTFAIQPGTGRLFINDVGQNTWEEINNGIAGSNYGWPTTEGATTNPSFRTPLFAYGHGTGPSTGCAIAGGAFYNPATVQFPSDHVGDYFFADLCSGWIRRLDPATGVVTAFASGFSYPVDLQVATDGSLYVLARGTNAVHIIRYTGG